MINRKQLLSYSLSSILACSLLSGVGFAAHKKKKAASATSTTSATTTAKASGTTTPAANAKNTRASRKAQAQKESAAAQTATPASGTPPASRGTSARMTAHNAAPAASASASDIASAKAKGMVWVNTESKVYHSGGRYYGNTKHGQFMTAADAQKAGYKAAKD